MYTKEQQDRIIQMYQAGNSINAIADTLKHGKNTVNKFLQQVGLIRSVNKFNPETEKQIVQEYLNGASASQLGEKYNCALKSILNIVRRHGAEVKSRGNSFKVVSEEDKILIKKMWNEGESRSEIAKKLGWGHETLDRIFEELGLPIEIRLQHKEQHHNWKGGRIVNESGYIIVLLDANDPFYSMTNSSGYILEHRYVMAKHLNLILEKNWSVHHIDGNKTNNSIDNLELHKTQHLPGKACQCGDCGSKNIIAIPFSRTNYENEPVKLPKTSDLFSDEEQQEIINEYKVTLSISETARKYNASRGTIRNILLRHGINTTSYRGTFEEDKDEFKQLWEQKVSNESLKQLFEISEATLNRWVNKLGLKLRRASAGGEDHGNWRGGQRTSTAGYIQLFIDKTDLFHCMTNGEGSVLEHRYVMAKHLGRPLTEDEKIHHIDGNKTNNSIENLQLVLKSHGKGQRYQCADCHSINIIDIPLNSDNSA